MNKKPPPIARFLALWLTLSLTLPNSSGASPELSRRTLRQTSTAQSGAEEKLTEVLRAPAADAGEGIVREMAQLLKLESGKEAIRNGKWKKLIEYLEKEDVPLLAKLLSNPTEVVTKPVEKDWKGKGLVKGGGIQGLLRADIKAAKGRVDARVQQKLIQAEANKKEQAAQAIPDGQVFLAIGPHNKKAHAERVFETVLPLLPPLPESPAAGDQSPEIVFHLEGIAPMSLERHVGLGIQGVNDSVAFARWYNSSYRQERSRGLQDYSTGFERGRMPVSVTPSRDPFWREMTEQILRVRRNGYRVRVFYEDPEGSTWWSWNRARGLDVEASEAFFTGQTDLLETLLKQADQMRYDANLQRDFQEEGPKINRRITRFPKATHVIVRGLQHEGIERTLEGAAGRVQLLRIVPEPDHPEKFAPPLYRVQQARRQGPAEAFDEAEERRLLLVGILMNVLGTPLTLAGEELLEFYPLLNDTVAGFSAEDVLRVSRSFRDAGARPTEARDYPYEAYYRLKVSFPQIFPEESEIVRRMERSITALRTRAHQGPYVPVSTALPPAAGAEQKVELSGRGARGAAFDDPDRSADQRQTKTEQMLHTPARSPSQPSLRFKPPDNRDGRQIQEQPYQENVRPERSSDKRSDHQAREDDARGVRRQPDQIPPPLGGELHPTQVYQQNPPTTKAPASEGLIISENNILINKTPPTSNPAAGAEEVSLEEVRSQIAILQSDTANSKEKSSAAVQIRRWAKKRELPSAMESEALAIVNALVQTITGPSRILTSARRSSSETLQALIAHEVFYSLIQEVVGKNPSFVSGEQAWLFRGILGELQRPQSKMHPAILQVLQQHGVSDSAIAVLQREGLYSKAALFRKSPEELAHYEGLTLDDIRNIYASAYEYDQVRNQRLSPSPPNPDRYPRSIVSLQVSSRVLNALRDGGIFTRNQLLYTPFKSLLVFPNMGLKSLEELQKAIRLRWGERLRTEEELARIPAPPAPSIEDLWPGEGLRLWISASGAEQVEAKITTPTDENFWDAFYNRLTVSQREAIINHLERARHYKREVEVTAVTGITDFHLHTDAGLAEVARRVSEAHPVEGIFFHFPGDLSQRDKTADAFEDPGLIIPDKMMLPFVWPEGSRPPVRVTEAVYPSDLAGIQPAGWIALRYNPNLTLEHLLSQDVLLITLHDDQGTAVLSFA